MELFLLKFTFILSLIFGCGSAWVVFKDKDVGFKPLFVPAGFIAGFCGGAAVLGILCGIIIVGTELFL